MLRLVVVVALGGGRLVVGVMRLQWLSVQVVVAAALLDITASPIRHMGRLVGRRLLLLDVGLILVGNGRRRRRRVEERWVAAPLQ